jgi:hypothetical protein
VFYRLSALLPPEMSDETENLIELAEPLSREKPTNYHTNRFGLPVRTGPNRTKLQRLKARALMKLVHIPEQFQSVKRSLTAIETLLQLEDRLRPFDVLMHEAKTWSEDDQLALLWDLWELSRSSSLLDVKLFVAASIPILHALGGETAFWEMYDRVEWACERLPLPS